MIRARPPGLRTRTISANAISHLLAQEPWSTADVDDLLTRSQAQPFKSGAPLGHDVWARIDRLELACRLVVELQHARASGRREPFYARYPRCEGSRSCSETADRAVSCSITSPARCWRNPLMASSRPNCRWP